MQGPRVFRSEFPDLSQLPFGDIAALEDPELTAALRTVNDAVRRPYGPLRGDSQNEEMAAQAQQDRSSQPPS
jgi:hypothetical protein